MRIITFVVLTTLIATQTVTAENPEPEEELVIESVERARLERAVGLLRDAEASNRYAAVQQIVHQARRGSSTSKQWSGLLVGMTGDPDSEVAALAARALERRNQTADPNSDDEALQAARPDRLQWATEVLSAHGSNRAPAADRLAAMHVLAHLASKRGNWSTEFEWLVRETWNDPDSEIASLAERVLARHEEREMHPFFTRPATASQEPSELSVEYESRADAMFAAAGAPDPETRLSSLHWIVDIALAEGTDSDPRILDTLNRLGADPDPSVASFVRFALGGLAGDRDSAGEVHVGR